MRNTDLFQMGHTKFLLVPLFAIAALVTAGCDTDQSKIKQSKQVTVATSGNDSVIQQAINSTTNNAAGNAQAKATASQVADEVVQRLEISYARLAANQSDVCPKLLEFQFANQSIVRSNERLQKNSCEYYIFLNQGERLRIKTTSEVKAELVSPIWHDFDNGDFKAGKFDKYIVRMSYNGARYNPHNFVYDIVITKNPSLNDS